MFCEPGTDRMKVAGACPEDKPAHVIGPRPARALADVGPRPGARCAVPRLRTPASADPRPNTPDAARDHAWTSAVQPTATRCGSDCGVGRRSTPHIRTNTGVVGTLRRVLIDVPAR